MVRRCRWTTNSQQIEVVEFLHSSLVSATIVAVFIVDALFVDFTNVTVFFSFNRITYLLKLVTVVKVMSYRTFWSSFHSNPSTSHRDIAYRVIRLILALPYLWYYAYSIVPIAILNITKTEEIVFTRLNPRLSLHPSPLPDIEQVKVAKLLGVVLSERLHFDDHVFAVLKYVAEALKSPGPTGHPIEYCISGSNIK